MSQGGASASLTHLQDAIEEACATVTSSDAIGWFRHCGYAVPDEDEQTRAYSSSRKGALSSLEPL